jgi:TrmH family RNA methyltransferase
MTSIRVKSNYGGKQKTCSNIFSHRNIIKEKPFDIWLSITFLKLQFNYNLQGMLSKNTIKFINSLRVKRYRNESGYFIAEGERLVDDIIGSTMQVKTLYHTSSWGKREADRFENVLVSVDEMKKISGLTSPSNVLALVSIPEYDIAETNLTDSIALALDGVQDPGNLGTIIRLADWFGIDSILCSSDTTDAFSPKVIQSCMGAISRVKIIYGDLPKILNEYTGLIPVYGTFMEGRNIYDEELTSKGIIVMGNEGNGIGPDVERLISRKIHIPSFANDRATVESLNVAMATAIICSEFRRRK